MAWTSTPWTRPAGRPWSPAASPGTPEEIADQIKARVLDQGVDGIVVNIMGNGHVEGVVASVGKALAPLVH